MEKESEQAEKFNSKDLQSLFYSTPYHLEGFAPIRKRNVIFDLEVNKQNKKSNETPFEEDTPDEFIIKSINVKSKAVSANNLFILFILGLCFIITGIAIGVVFILLENSGLSAKNIYILNVAIVSLFFVFVIGCFSAYYVIQNALNPFRAK